MSFLGALWLPVGGGRRHWVLGIGAGAVDNPGERELTGQGTGQWQWDVIYGTVINSKATSDFLFFSFLLSRLFDSLSVIKWGILSQSDCCSLRLSSKPTELIDFSQCRRCVETGHHMILVFVLFFWVQLLFSIGFDQCQASFWLTDYYSLWGWLSTWLLWWTFSQLYGNWPSCCRWAFPLRRPWMTFGDLLCVADVPERPS